MVSLQRPPCMVGSNNGMYKCEVFSSRDERCEGVCVSGLVDFQIIATNNS